MKERLQKVLAGAGIASRRAAERLIGEGRVAVNGAVVREQGVRVDPDHDVVKVDGKRIPARPATRTYLVLNKPRGFVTTLSDPEGRPTIRELIRGVSVRVFPVGRLDFNSEGLLLLTDDGVLARDLMHPGNGVPKTYEVKVRGRPDRSAIDRLSRGIRLEGKPTLPAEVRLLKPGANTWLEVTVFEGRKHQVRRMLDVVGHPVAKLRRVSIDGLSLGKLPTGEWRPLTATEIGRLRRGVRARAGRP